MALRRWIVAGVACASLTGCGSAAVPPISPPPPPPAATTEATKPARAPIASPPIAFPRHGPRKWVIAPAQSGAPSGPGGQLWRYQVRIEKDITGVPIATFAETIRKTLADPRGWTTGDRRFERVGAGSDYDFIVHLATPDTRDAMCGDTPDGYTSCRNGANVMLNVARWAKGVPGFGGEAGNLALYRTYMINHEIGHRLGYRHQRCPGTGDPAPVMQQQTLGLHGCTPQPWPYPKGELYQGPPGVYADRIPSS